MHEPAQCERCPLLNLDVYVPMQRVLYPQMDVLFVGRNAGKTEVVTQVPFTGQAGKMCWVLMQRAGINKRNVSVTNCVHCYTPDDRVPTKMEMDFCRPLLKHEIHVCQPKLIVALGGEALWSLTGEEGIMRRAGGFYPLKKEYNYECLVLATYHPSFVMRARQYIPIAIEHLDKVNHPEVWKESKDIHMAPNFILDPTPAQLSEFLFRPGKDRIIMFDIETTGLERDAKLLGIGFSDGQETMSVSFGDIPRLDPRWADIVKWLESPNCKKGAQNGSFDISRLGRYSVNVRGLVYDTRFGQQLINSDLPADLDFMRAMYTTIPPYKPSKKGKDLIGTWSKERLMTYNCWDAFTTWWVMDEQVKRFEPGDLKVIQELMIPMIEVTNYMEDKGILVDTNGLAVAYARLGPRRDELEERINKELGVNPNSPKQIKELLGLPDTERETLEAQILRQHPKSSQMKMILEFRDLNKVLSTYLKGVYDRLDSANHIHTHYKLEGTGTGRLSSSDPNLQNVPDLLRILFLAEAGSLLVGGDYKALELRVAAVLADAESLLADFEAGLEPHRELAADIYRRSTFSDRELLATKSVVFGTLYGRSARSIAIQFGVTIAQAESWQRACILRYPELIVWRDKTIQEWQKQGYLVTPFGRKRICAGYTQALNFRVQSCASDVTVTRSRMLYDEGFDLRLNVHDQLVCQIVEDDVYLQMARAMKQIMMRPVPQLKGYVFPVKLEHGKTWAMEKGVLNV